jgi:hypothetical protein
MGKRNQSSTDEKMQAEHHLGPIGTRRKSSAKQTFSASVALPLTLLERLDAWCAQQFVVPSRSAAMRKILTSFLDEAEKTKGE